VGQRTVRYLNVDTYDWLMSLPVSYSQLDVRKTWPDEVNHLTPWVIDHLPDLASHLGTTLEFVARETPAGCFRADIKARDADGRKVLIENQFGPTDHEHFGQLVLYACELRADVVVWISAGSRALSLSPFRPEHSDALMRLNRVFAGQISFFGVALEVSSEPQLIADGTQHPLLPRFKVVVRPSPVGHATSRLSALAELVVHDPAPDSSGQLPAH
jgi:hypothetical protein